MRICCLAIKILSYKYKASILQGEIDVDQVTVHTNKNRELKILCFCLVLVLYFFFGHKAANFRVNGGARFVQS